MSLLDKASLIITPNAYKESVLYSVVPNTTLGDMDVVRATTATRVNSAGLIEVVPRNLLQYSNTFNNGVWVAGSTITLTSGQVGYDGTNNAWLLSKGVLQYTALAQSVSSSGVKTLSIYAKANTNNKISLFASSSPSNFYQDFNLSNGTLGPDSFGVVNALIENVGNGWYRCSVVFSENTTSFIIFPDNVNGGNSGSVFIQDSQIESGSLTEYFPTTTRLNIPRIDYTNGSCPSLLVEPQRTNLALYSEQFENAYWVKSESTTTANFAISPNGTMSADTITVNSNNAVHRITNTISITTATTYTLSIYAKKNNFDFIFFRENIDGNFTNTFFNVSNGNLGSIGLGRTAKIQNVGNGWFRCSITGTSALTSYSLGVGVCNTDGVISFLGNGTDYNLIWGAQLEAGSYATSYIPTVASTVTRNADVISKTGISSLIGQTEGTIFLEADIQKRNASDFYIAISNGFSLAESIYLNQPSSGNLNVLFRTGVLTPTIVVLSANWNIGNNKIAIAYNSTLGEVFINGVSKGTIALTAIPTCNQIALGSRPDSPGGLVGAGPYKQAILFKTRLTNTELQSLTTL